MEFCAALTKQAEEKVTEYNERVEKKEKKARDKKNRVIRLYGNGTRRAQFYKCVNLSTKYSGIQIARRLCQDETGYDWVNSGDR